ncbi:MAG: conserved membrane protein of unknown function [Promethearchaeota archaeon]|nr:MAG: conserved membrane protein of unknown function [Candidatus Lokiarchaeota archaeon]
MSISISDFLNGLFALFTILICFIVGLIIVIRYFQVRKIELLYIGLAWMAIYQPWWPSTLDFLFVVFTETQRLDPRLYIFFGSFFIPVTGTFWLMGITELIIKKRQKLILGFYLAITIIVDIYILTFLSIDYTAIGDYAGIGNFEYEPLMAVYLMFINITVAVSGIMLGRESLKSSEKDINMRGKLLISASVCYILGGFLDVGVFSLIPPALIISRVILILGSFLFYMGFLLPNFIKKRL